MRTVVFWAVIAAAAAVVVHSIATDRAVEADAPRDGTRASGLSSASIVGTLGTGEGIVALLGDHEFVFAVLPGDGGRTGEVSRLVLGATEKLRARGVRTASFTLDPTSGVFADAVERFGVESLPAVLALREGCGPQMLKSPITETMLLKAYLECGSASASCCPGGCRAGGTCGGNVD